tara:strand:- start:217 stop:699 length:483 start_codon:yes stop_codon:yes gene_type:complete
MKKSLFNTAIRHSSKHIEQSMTVADLGGERFDLEYLAFALPFAVPFSVAKYEQQIGDDMAACAAAEGNIAASPIAVASNVYPPSDNDLAILNELSIKHMSHITLVYRTGIYTRDVRESIVRLNRKQHVFADTIVKGYPPVFYITEGGERVLAQYRKLGKI